LDLVQMMENAGRSLAAVAIARYRPRTVRILAGTGRNGGGGMVAARHLAARGVSVEVTLTRGPDELTGVPADQFRVLASAGVQQSPPAPAALVLDAVIGYSLAGAPQGRARELIDWAGSCGSPVLSLDTPSGVDVTTGAAPGPAVDADATLTLALPKSGLVDHPKVGAHHLADLTIPARVYDAIGVDVPPDLFAPGQILHLT
ncbi:MAG: NAD(P)H-hydrate epimerase, partial [Actinomycetota bacterium]